MLRGAQKVVAESSVATGFSTEVIMDAKWAGSLSQVSIQVLRLVCFGFVATPRKVTKEKASSTCLRIAVVSSSGQMGDPQ